MPTCLPACLHPPICTHTHTNTRTHTQTHTHAHTHTHRFRHGGAPAPGATTAGSVSDTRDISRNVERAAYLAAAGEAADPLQRRIYDAETTKVRTMCMCKCVRE